MVGLCAISCVPHSQRIELIVRTNDKCGFLRVCSGPYVLLSSSCHPQRSHDQELASNVGGAGAYVHYMCGGLVLGKAAKYSVFIDRVFDAV